MTAILAENLLLYSAQIAVILGAAAWLERVWMQGREPRARLWHWQVALGAALLIPLLSPWQAPEVVVFSASPRPGRTAEVNARSTDAPPMDWQTFLVAAVAIVGALLLLRMVLGAVRLGLYRRRSELLFRDGATEFRLSEDVSGPITFGLRRPVVLLPASFVDLAEEWKQAICSHERLHIERKDWLWALFEEAVRSLLWFHPAVWFAIAGIQLAREQVVDHSAILATGNRDAYLDALLAMAGVRPRLDIVAAPLFLRKWHLNERLEVILKEVEHMSPKQLRLAVVASGLAVFTVGVSIALLLPLRAPAQQAGSYQARSTPAAGLPILLHRVEPGYPPDALVKRVQGTVTVAVDIDERGLVSDARIVSGPEELRRAALQAVLEWQFAAPNAPLRGNVDMTFTLPDAPPDQPYPAALTRIEYLGVPTELMRRIAPLLPVKGGDPLTPEARMALEKTLTGVDRRLQARVGSDGTLSIRYAGQRPEGSALEPSPPQRIRVGGMVQEKKLRHKVQPEYPPLARQARIQGTVRFDVLIGREGQIKSAELISGHPLLAKAAIEAIQQWEYETTLLNGNPVEVITQVDVNFTLPQ